MFDGEATNLCMYVWWCKWTPFYFYLPTKIGWVQRGPISRPLSHLSQPFWAKISRHMSQHICKNNIRYKQVLDTSNCGWGWVEKYTNKQINWKLFRYLDLALAAFLNKRGCLDACPKTGSVLGFWVIQLYKEKTIYKIYMLWCWWEQGVIKLILGESEYNSCHWKREWWMTKNLVSQTPCLWDQYRFL